MAWHYQLLLRHILKHFMDEYLLIKEIYYYLPRPNTVGILSYFDFQQKDGHFANFISY
jgi:hypothetical protein